MVQSDTLDRAFSALSDPTRREILELLTPGPASISELARPIGISLSGVLKHIRVLEGADLVTTEKTGRSRRCHLAPGHMDEVARWIEAYRDEWEGRLDRLEGAGRADEGGNEGGREEQLMRSSGTVDVQRLRDGVDGMVIVPDDEAYDDARTVFYGGIDRRPAAIVRVANATDVARVIALARETGLELAVRSGGHSIPGYCVTDGGIVLDVADMRAIDVDAEARTVWAETGLTAVEYSDAVGAHGLATGFGDTGSVGIGGITLAGGVGYLVRKHGLTIDSLLAADVVTANGELLRVDAGHHPDLFWAIRGGGGNFGVATRFQFRVHRLPSVVGGVLMLPATGEVIAAFVAEAEAAPDELSAIANIMPAPPMPFVPEEHRGRLVVMALMAYAGPTEAGERAIAPFRALAEPIVDMLRPMPYPEIYPPEEEGYHPTAVARTMFIDSVGHAEADLIMERLQATTAMMGIAQIRVLGGAMARVPADATAFAHRTSRIMVNVAALYEHPDERAEHEPWVTGFHASLRQGAGRAYVGFLDNEGPERIREAYPGATWDRLRAVKARYDPSNLFRLNQNIPPAAEWSPER